MKKWPHKVWYYTPHEVQIHAVQNQEWQQFRITLKGLSTEDKLDSLDQFRDSKLQSIGGTDDVTDERGQTYHYELFRVWQVPIDNYINALYRGGLLNNKLEVVK